METPNKCPTCGEQPTVHFRLAGQTAFFPVIEAVIECKECRSGMAYVICHDEATFKEMDKRIESLIEQWNRRNRDGRSS